MSPVLQAMTSIVVHVWAIFMQLQAQPYATLIKRFIGELSHDPIISTTTGIAVRQAIQDKLEEVSRLETEREQFERAAFDLCKKRHGRVAAIVRGALRPNACFADALEKRFMCLALFELLVGVSI